jgi:hypothetical protein
MLILMLVGFVMVLLVLLMVILLLVMTLVGGRLMVFVSRGLQVVLLHVVLLRKWVPVPVGDRLLPVLVVLSLS